MEIRRNGHLYLVVFLTKLELPITILEAAMLKMLYSVAGSKCNYSETHGMLFCQTFIGVKKVFSVIIFCRRLTVICNIIPASLHIVGKYSGQCTVQGRELTKT